MPFYVASRHFNVGQRWYSVVLMFAILDVFKTYGENLPTSFARCVGEDNIGYTVARVSNPTGQMLNAK